MIVAAVVKLARREINRGNRTPSRLGRISFYRFGIEAVITYYFTPDVMVEDDICLARVAR